MLCLIFPATSYADGRGALVNANPLTITSGGTWQVLFPINNNRSTLWIENPCTATTQGIVTAESIFIAFGANPVSGTAGSFELQACGSLTMTGTYVSQQPVWIYAATTSHAFAAAQTQ